VARYIVGKKINDFSGASDGAYGTNAFHAQYAGKVRTPGRVVGAGGWLGGDGVAVNRAKLAVYSGEMAWDPQNSLTPLAWFKADAITGLVDNDPVASWANLGSSGAAATNGTGAQRPLYKTNILDGKPVVRFDGSNDILTATGVNIPAIASIFAVFKTPSSGASEKVVYASTGNNHSLSLFQVSASDATMVQLPFAPQYSTIEALSTWEIHSNIYNTTVSRGARNTVNSANFSLGTSGVTAANLSIGAAIGGSLPAGIDLAELIIFNTAVDLPTQYSIEGYLAWKWGLEGLLRADHYYKILPPITGQDDPVNEDPYKLLLETSEFSIQNIWNGELTGGKNYEAESNLPWTPAEISATRMKYWFAADKLTGVSSGAGIPQLTDFSGNGNHATQATGANQATYLSNAINGLPGANFDGVNDYYNLLGPSSISMSQSIFVVIKASDQPIDQALMTFADNNGGLGFYINSTGFPALYKQGTGNILVSGNAAPDNVFCILAANFVQGAAAIYVNGNGWGGTHSITLSAPANGYLIGWSDNNSPTGPIAEIIILQEPYLKDTAEHYRIEGYLSAKYGIALRTNHPYYNNPPKLRGPVVLEGQDLFVSVAAADGFFRAPARYEAGRKMWIQPTSDIDAPDPWDSPFEHTTESLYEVENFMYAVVEENRPPVVTSMSPGNGSVVNTNKPTFSFSTTDPDRTDGFLDYIKRSVIRVFEKFKDGLSYAGQISYTPSIIPSAGYTPEATSSTTWPMFVPSRDLANRMTSQLQSLSINQADLTAVALWGDQSGNGNTAIQNTAGNKPTYRTGQIAGLGAVDFDHLTADYMNMATVSASSRDEAIFAVVRVDSLSGTLFRIILGPSAVGGRFLGIDTTGHLQWGKWGTTGVISTPTITTGQWVIVHAVVTPNTIRLGINGTVDNFIESTALTSSLTTILGAGVIGSGVEQYFDGMMADVIRMPASDLRPGDEERIVAYLAHGYGLTANLPAAHPYKTISPGLRMTFMPPVAGANTTRYEEWRTSEGSPVNGAVGTWTDKGTPAVNASQSTTANKPTLGSNKVNGYTSVSFDGVNDYMTSALSSSVLDRAVFAVVRMKDLSSVPALMGTSGAGGLIYYLGTTGTVRINKNTVGDIGAGSVNLVPLSEWTIVHWIVRATSWEVGVNGRREFGTHAQTLTAGLTSTIGSGTTGAGNFFNGDIATIISLPASDLGVNGVDRMNGFLAHKYGLEAKLPDDHPFRYDAPGDPVEHHWTVEVMDEVGGATGTGYGARTADSDLPDGTTEFYPYLGPWGQTSFPVQDSKLYLRTPYNFNMTMRNDLGSGAANALRDLRIRTLKKNTSGEYEVEQDPGWFDYEFWSGSTVSPGGAVNFYWWMANLQPLAMGADYRVEFMLRDKSLRESPWQSAINFHTNYIPDQGTISSPVSPTAVTGFPLVLGTVDDADDTAIAWFSELSSQLLVYSTVGSLGSGNGQFNAPMQIASDGSGNIYVADSANGRYQKVDYVSGYISQNTLPLVGVSGIDIDTATGDVFIAQPNGTVSEIIRYNSAGTQLAVHGNIAYRPLMIEIGSISGSGNKGLFYAKDRQRTLWVSDINTAGTVGGGTTITSGIGDSMLTSGWGVYAGAWVWVADNAQASLKGFWNYGTLAYEISDYLRILSPIGIAEEPLTRNVWVTDNLSHTIMEYSKEGEFLRQWGGYGSASGKLNDPMSLDWLLYNYGMVIVSDSSNNRVQTLSILGGSFDAVSKGYCAEVAIQGPMTVTNQDFNTSASGWVNEVSGTITASSPAINTLSPYDGTGHLRSTITAATVTAVDKSVYAAVRMNSGIGFPVVPGNVYGVKAKFRRSNTSWYGRLAIRWIRADGTYEQQSFGEIVRPTANVWTEASVSDVCPLNATVGVIVLLGAPDKVSPTVPVDLDWDMVKIDDGVRFLRPMTYIAGDSFSYQMVSGDMTAKGAYTLQMRGRDNNSAGPWSDPISINYVDGPAATLLTPVSGQVFNTATPYFNWILTAGEQWEFRVEVLDAVTGATVYDSGWIQSVSARTFQVPVGYLVDGGSYFGRLSIGNGQIQVLV